MKRRQQTIEGTRIKGENVITWREISPDYTDKDGTSGTFRCRARTTEGVHRAFDKFVARNFPLATDWECMIYSFEL
jgi:hypothetical protein